jgi:hypothetical protein
MRDAASSMLCNCVLRWQVDADFLQALGPALPHEKGRFNDKWERLLCSQWRASLGTFDPVSVAE